MPGELRAIVGKQVFRRPTVLNQPVQDLDDMLATQPLPDLDRQALPAVDIDNCQGPELLPVAMLVVDEVQTPGLVQSLRLAARLALHRHLAPPRPLAAQRQSFPSRWAWVLRP